MLQHTDVLIGMHGAGGQQEGAARAQLQEQRVQELPFAQPWACVCVPGWHVWPAQWPPAAASLPAQHALPAR